MTCSFPKDDWTLVITDYLNMIEHNPCRKLGYYSIGIRPKQCEDCNVRMSQETYDYFVGMSNLVRMTGANLG